ncbi:concanavalin A-like lectin/glucanase domain-containing protein, partial [Lipomyces arxii]|uniref:concanavalin A-like lectin/glucanase domain-containing protein n=1 Tax=Lipomyces arxii TaxID=56418 RepID=UPI0034CDF709
CSPSTPCPESAPCCSLSNVTGIGAYCLGGCNPQSSFDVNSCAPQPICHSKTYSFNNLDQLISNTEYLGDSSSRDFVYSGYPLSANDTLLITMPNNSVGTVVASTSYIWYGKVSVTMRSSRGRGVVTACILFSDVQDEIDWEFVGVDLETVQTNFYYQGILDWHNSVNVSLSDTFDDWHTYTVDWTEESITWSVDGQIGRVLNKADTFNATSGEYSFPQTPSRVQMSIWPGGLASNAPGTIDWAGGEIIWDSPDIETVGYFYGMVSNVTVECYDPPSFVNPTGKSYRYLNRNGTQESVVITDEDTVLASFEASGNDMDAGASSAAPSSAAPASTAVSSPSATEESSTAQPTSTMSIPDASEVTSATSSA